MATPPPMGSGPADACALPDTAWYLADPGNSGFPSDFMACLDGAELYPKCVGCACRRMQSATDANGTTLNFVECVILSDGEACSATSCGDASGGSASTSDSVSPTATTAAPATTTPTPTTTAPAATTAAPATTTAAPATTTAAPATTETPLATVVAAGDSASGSAADSASTTATSSESVTPSSSGSDSYNDWSDSSAEGQSVSTGSSSSSSSKTVLAAVGIGVAVLAVALLVLWLRSYCKKRAERNDKAFDGVTTATAQRTPAFGGAARQPQARYAPNSGRARAASRTRSNSRTTARSTPRSTPHSTPQSLPIVAPSVSSSNDSSAASGDSRSTRSSGGSVFSASVNNSNAAIFSYNTARQQTAGGQSRRTRNEGPRSTGASTLSSASRSTDAYSSRRGPTQGQYDIPETKWSVYSEERDRSTVGRGMSSMISDYSDIDGRSTQFDERDTNVSAMSFFSDDSEFDRQTTASERRREREF